MIIKIYPFGRNDSKCRLSSKIFEFFEYLSNKLNRKGGAGHRLPSDSKTIGEYCRKEFSTARVIYSSQPSSFMISPRLVSPLEGSYRNEKPSNSSSGPGWITQ